jgi:hypothetical protein
MLENRAVCFPALADMALLKIWHHSIISGRGVCFLPLNKIQSYNMINQNPQMKPSSSRVVVVVDVDCVDFFGG